ncbi:MAG: S8 family serine peptidase [candidate division WOR-3 bacterium]
MLLCLLLLSLSNPEFVRVAQKHTVPVLNTSKVWVFFTDKAIFNVSQYDKALSILKNAKVRKDEKRFDFADLPVQDRYIQRIEALGAKLRSVSRWLNAASFEMPPELISEVFRLPFVYDIKPVGSGNERFVEEIVPIAQPQPAEKIRGIDTAEAHRFYGNSWDQAQMLGVPEVFYKGYYGSKVKLALFDTGIKLKHQAVQRLRIAHQYDFISGDNFYFISEKTPQPTPIPSLRYLGLVKHPAIAVTPNNLFLTFVADSFNYFYGSPRRAIFFSYSTDQGENWSEPLALLLSRTEHYTFENLKMVSRDSVTYLAFNELPLLPGTTPTCYLGYFIGKTWFSPQIIGPGRNPTLGLFADTLYLVYITGDSLIAFTKLSIIQPGLTAFFTTIQPLPERLTDPQISVGPNGLVNIFALGSHSGRIFHLQSLDGGNTFTSLPDLSIAGARLLQLYSHPQEDSIKVLLYLDENVLPFTRLMMRISTDYGTTWQPALTVDSALTIGGYALNFSANMKLIFESAGFLYQKKSTDLGRTWQDDGIIDSTGFCSSPNIGSFNDHLFSIWFKRGDENAVWEDADTVKFAREQPYHGTRMASLIAGYQPYSFMGIAPGVDLLIARTEFHKTASNRYYEYNMEEDTYIQALEWAERCGADVVSTSLGYRDWLRDDQFDGKTAPVSIAASLAAKRGMLIVTAMGNRDAERYPWPTPYIVAPGDAEGVITCGGVEKNLTPWRGSGTGPTSDGRIKPDLVALSDTVVVVAPDTQNLLEGSIGTSCATALIAGCCALLKEAHPSWGAESIKIALFSTATNSVKNCSLGYGVPRIDSAFKIYPPEPQVPPIIRDRIGTIFPNPFIAREDSKIYFGINLTRTTPLASISIFTVSGKLVNTIHLDVSQLPTPGRYQGKATLEKIGAFWDGKNSNGKPVGTGLYLAVLKTTFSRDVAKFTLVR